MKGKIERQLSAVLPPARTRLAAAMRHGALGAGKRLRPMLCLAAARACGSEHAALPYAVAIELIHCYSLIHDDLPCMDDDALRRGKPAVHAEFGTALAVLAGDALQALAFAQLASLRSGGAAQAALAGAAGWRGMCAGQAEDLAASATSEAALRRMHKRKTGALLSAALELGALAAQASPSRRAKLASLGMELGLIFQIADDILDATATSSELGKSAGKDRSHGKATYVSVLGLERTRARLLSHNAKVRRLLGKLRGDCEMLRALHVQMEARTAQ